MSQRRTLIAVALSAMLLGLAGLWAWSQQSDDRVNRAPITADSIVMLGDSITEEAPWDTAFPADSVVNHGYSGFSTSQLVDVARSIARAKPRAVYVLAGTNDVRLGFPPDWTIEHLAMILEELASEAPDTIVVIQTVLPWQDHADEVRATNRAITQLAAERDLDVIDLHAVFDNGLGGLRSGETFDGLHLSKAGNDRWMDLLRQDFAAR